MRYDNQHGFNSSGDDRAKDKQLLLNYIRKTIERSTGRPLKEILSISAHIRYRIGLTHVTTTNKAICEALVIPVEAGTRYKRMFEKKSELVSSLKRQICPFTTEGAHFLTANPDKFNDVLNL